MCGSEFVSMPTIGRLGRRRVPLVDEDRRAPPDVVREVRGDERLLVRRLAVVAERHRHAARHLRDAVAAVERHQRRADRAERQRRRSLRHVALDPGDRLEQRRRHVHLRRRRAARPRPLLDRRLREERVAREQHVEAREVHRLHVQLAVFRRLVRRRRRRECARIGDACPARRRRERHGRCDQCDDEQRAPHRSHPAISTSALSETR